MRQQEPANTGVSNGRALSLLRGQQRLLVAQCLVLLWLGLLPWVPPPTLEGCGHSLIVYSSPHIYACQTPNILPPDLDMQTEKAEAQCPTLRTLDPKATTTRTLLCEGLSSEPTASNCRSFGGPAQKRSLVCLPSERWAGEGVVGPSPQYPATTPNHLGAILSFLPVSLRPWRSS